MNRQARIYPTITDTACKTFEHANTEEDIFQTPSGKLAGAEITQAIALADVDEAPAIGAFLDFLERVIRRNPQRLRSLSPTLAARVKALTQGVEVDLDAPLSPNDK